MVEVENERRGIRECACFYDRGLCALNTDSNAIPSNNGLRKSPRVLGQKEDEGSVRGSFKPYLLF